MQNNKAPVSGGSSKQFYSLYFYLFANTYVEIMNKAFENGSLSFNSLFHYLM